MFVTINKDGPILNVKVTGRVDANTAPDFDAQIEPNMKGVNKLLIDASELEYISSAGLRVILKYKKLCPCTKIIEASNEAYDIFQMTGFTEMMEIQKKLREISVEGCKIIGQGYYGTVYRLSKDTIVKVYSKKLGLERIENERELARKAFVLGVPTAIPYDIVKVGDLYGSVFELLDAETLQEKILNDMPHIAEYCIKSIQVLKVIHSAQVKPGELKDKKAEVLGWAESIKPLFTPEVGERIISLVKGINEDHHILHGDYHIKNVMMIGDEPFIIDMDTLAMGSPIFELGFMYSSYVGYQELDHNNSMQFFGIEHEKLIRFYENSLRLYCPHKSEEEIKVLYKKCRILCYIQLIDRFDKFRDHLELYELFKKTIAELVYEVDDLNL